MIKGTLTQPYLGSNKKVIFPIQNLSAHRSVLAVIKNWIMDLQLEVPRITSYNVCYTKLLRGSALDFAFAGRGFNVSIPLPVV